MKSSSPVVPLGPWIKGIQNVNDPVMTPKGCLIEAENVLIDSGGVVSPRAGYDLVTAGGHSLFKFQNRSFGVLNGHIVEFLESNAKPLFAGIDGKVSWGVLNDMPVFTNNGVLGFIEGEVGKLIGVEEPGGFAVSNPGGTIAVAISFVSGTGEEGPLSAATKVGTHSTLHLPLPLEATATKVRVYQTKPDGDVLYEVSEVDPGSNYKIETSVEYGRPATTQFKSRMPGGSYVRYWRGRLLVVRGHTLFVSEPMRYGLYDASSGRVPFEGRIDFIEPVEGGVFVGLRGIGVRFLAGDSPDKWENKLADVIPAQPGGSLIVPTAQMKLEMQFPPDWVAVWFTQKGFALGLPNGNVIYPQADLLSGLPLGNGSLHFEGDRLIALSQ